MNKFKSILNNISSKIKLVNSWNKSLVLHFPKSDLTSDHLFVNVHILFLTLLHVKSPRLGIFVAKGFSMF